MAKFQQDSFHKLYDDISFVPTGMGNYGFYKVIEGRYKVRYIGRSDSNLQDEIDQQRNKKKDKGYTHFKYATASSKTEAYEEECRNYHEFGENVGLDNEIHPRKPKDNGHYNCPEPSCFYHQ
ncbi:MAG: hypothetical protein K6F10_01985 [Paludibacteraceae bacterium]|nr:hypothetical protein [Paludibacteraceae bacterium]